MNQLSDTKHSAILSPKLTQFSRGAGCGCKIAPAVLDKILKNNEADMFSFTNLLVGNSSKDDAAVWDLGDGKALISTTDFFMPIVDDAYDFGRIASANAISDVYAMGGKPVMAIAILGWPIDKLSPELAQRVIEGSRSICREAGIPLAGGHSIDSTEPIFGLAVNGIVNTKNIKKNNTAKPGDLLFLSKALGTGIFSTAMKKGILKNEDYPVFLNNMIKLNKIGEKLGNIDGVNAMTDITGFGLIGHLVEVCQGSHVSAEIIYKNVPLMEGIEHYTSQFCFPDNTYRNWNSYEPLVEGITGNSFITLNDPQTSGGLLISVSPGSLDELKQLFKEFDLFDYFIPIGSITEKKAKVIKVIE